MRRTLSVRLDEAAMKALSRFEASGMSPSQAIRRALIEAAERLRKREALVAEVAALAADDADRAEMLVVTAMMETLHAQG